MSLVRCEALVLADDELLARDEDTGELVAIHINGPGYRSLLFGLLEAARSRPLHVLVNERQVTR